MDTLMAELFDVTNEFVEEAPMGLLVTLIPYFIIIVGALAGRKAKAWIGPFFILFGGFFLQIYRKVFGAYEIKTVWLVASVIIVCASFINLQFIKRPTIKYIKDTLYVGDLVTLLVFGAFLGYGVLKISSPEKNVGFLPCILIALIIMVITVFLYETVTTIFVTAAGSAGLLLAINQLSYYNPYEETPDKTYLLFLFLKVFAAGALVQTVIFVVSSAKIINREKEIEANEKEIKEREEKYLEKERRAKETKDGAFDYLDEHTTPDEKRELARKMLGLADGQEIAEEERAKLWEAKQAAEDLERLENEAQARRDEFRREMEWQYQMDHRWDGH